MKLTIIFLNSYAGNSSTSHAFLELWKLNIHTFFRVWERVLPSTSGWRYTFLQSNLSKKTSATSYVEAVDVRDSIIAIACSASPCAAIIATRSESYFHC